MTRFRSLLYLPIFLLALSPVFSSAQSLIRGALVDENNEPLPYAGAMLLQAADSSLVKGEVSDDAGVFRFQDIIAGQYYVAISMVGYEDHYSELLDITSSTGNLDLGLIAMEPAALNLEAVEVKAKKTLFEQRIDRLVVNVAQSITASGSTALDVLEKSPGVVVNRQDNSILMAGKDGVVIMVNNKINRMPMSALIQMLAGMPSDNIEKIELITTPPANFDAQGNAGIINIILKKNLEEGLNGNFSLIAGYGANEKYGGNVNFNYRKGAINLYGDYGYMFNHTAQEFTNYRSVFLDGVQTENDIVSDRDPTTTTQNARLGVDIELGDKTVLGLLGSWSMRDWKMDALNTVNIAENGILREMILIDNFESNVWKSYLGNINLQHQFSEDSRLTVDLDYARYSNDNPTDYINDFFDGENNLIERAELRVGKETPIDIWVGKFDYSHTFKEGLSFEAGAKGTLSRFDNDFSVENLENGIWVVDDQFTAEYALEENIGALYSSLSWQLTKKTGIKAGLRYEYTTSNLGTIDRPNIVDRQYGSFFPSLFMSHSVGENNELQLSYSRRIDRPAYTQLAPFVIFLDPNTLLAGNEALQPAFTDAFNLNYRIKSWFLSLGYSFTDEAIAGFQPSVDPETNLQVNSPINLDNRKSINASLSFPLKVTEWWSMRNNLMAFWNQNNAIIDGFDVSEERTTFRANTTQNFKLPWGVNLEISGYYMSPVSFGLVISEPLGDMDIGLMKNLGDNKGSIRLNLQNLFLTGNWESSANQPDLNLLYRGRFGFQERVLRLTYTRNFGRDQIKAARQRSTGSEAERNRVQN